MRNSATTNYPIYSDRDRHFASRDGNYEILVFDEFIEQLQQQEAFVNSVEAGIVAKVDAEGTEGLSEKQGYVLQKIVERHAGQECLICGCSIPLNEVLLDNDGLCSYHKYVADKDND